MQIKKAETAGQTRLNQPSNDSISQKTDLSTQNSKIVLEDGKASQDLFEDMDEADIEGVAHELSDRERLAAMLESELAEKGF